MICKFCDCTNVPIFRNFWNSDIIVKCTVDCRFHHILDSTAYILTVKHHLTLCVYNLTLFVHNFVVLKNVLTRIKVSAFKIFLCIFDCICKHFCLDRLVLFKTKCVNHRLNLVTAENSHKIIIKWKEELRYTGVTLTTCTTSKLIVDTSWFVTFSTYNIQTAKLANFVLFRLDLCFEFVVKFGKYFSCIDNIFIICITETCCLCDKLICKSLTCHFMLSHIFCITAKVNVGTTTRHVCCDCYSTFFTCLCNDFSLFCVILRI